MEAFIRIPPVMDRKSDNNINEIIHRFNLLLKNIGTTETVVSLNTTLDNIPTLTAAEVLYIRSEAEKNGYKFIVSPDEHDSTSYKLRTE